MSSIRILGIDPGLTHMGWGIIEKSGHDLRFIACGTISPKAKQPIAARLKTLHDELQRICDLYKPNVAAIEETFVNTNSKSSLTLGNARGAILLSLSIAGLEINEYAARLVKKSITGSGRAEKEQVEMMVQTILPACRPSDGEKNHRADTYDALAIAITHANHNPKFM